MHLIIWVFAQFLWWFVVCKTTEDKTTSLGGEAYEVPDQNVECVFPFSFEGEVYSKCTNEFACETCFWCGTTYNVTDATGWGLCNEFCPTENGEWCIMLSNYKFYTQLTSIKTWSYF